MEIYNIYQQVLITLCQFTENYPQLFAVSIMTAVNAWLALFILQGIGLSTMAKKRGIKKRWLAFIPFANIWYFAKLAGECHAFGHKVKRVGIYAMIAQILTALLAIVMIVAEVYFSLKYDKLISLSFSSFYVTEEAPLSVLTRTEYNFYVYSSFVLSILVLLFRVLIIIIMTAICKKYTPRHFMLFSILSFVEPLSRFIIIFCLRNRKAIDYEAYVRQQREEYMRRQQQYRNMYGNPYNPYNNPYGNPYYRGNPYGQNNTQNQEDKPKEEPKDEPFSEFSSDTTNDNSSANTTQGSSNAKDDPDDFFS